jgi:tetratricopeptide (TPR) repeat protein
MTFSALPVLKRKIMKRKACIVWILMISFAAYGQTFNENARNLFKMGTQKVADKNYTGAIEDFTNAIKADPRFKQAYENRGVAKFYLEDIAGAIEDYSKALDIDPNDYTTYGRRGWAKFYLHDYTGAISDLDKAVYGSKDRFRYCNFRGEAKFRLRDFEGAIDDFTRVIRSLSSDREQKGKAYYWRGEISIIQGKKDSGCTDLKKAARAGYPGAAEALKDKCDN